MRDIGILFQAPMVLAILREVDSKTQTRRVVKGWALDWLLPPISFSAEYVALPENGASPYGYPGDKLWVRETFYAYGRWETRFNPKKGRDEWHFVDMTQECGRPYMYAADLPEVPSRQPRGATPVWHKRPAIHMPRVASRKTPPLDLGIGIETGPVMVGSFGPAHRRVHSVLGETVTIAARLEALTAELAYPILVGPEAVRQSGSTDTKALGDFLLAGLSRARKVHALPVEYDANHLHLVYSVEQDKALSF